MTLEETIQEMYDNYPMLFQERKECLNQLFCVIGNGYDWIDGELISSERQIHKYEEDKGRYILDYIDNTPVQLKDGGKAKQTLSGGKAYDKIFRNKFEWYPLSKFSYAINYPDDIKEDWLQGIEETKRLLIGDGIDLRY
ncbi:TPA: hypothetical protein ACF2DD_002128 [Clostridium perfringens]